MKLFEVLKLVRCALLHKKHHREEWGYFSVWIYCDRCERVVQRTILP